MPELSHENLEKQPTSSEENLEMKKSILTQEELIEESGLEAEEWVDKYGKRFRQIITENPELLNDKEEIKKELEKETIH